MMARNKEKLIVLLIQYTLVKWGLKGPRKIVLLSECPTYAKYFC